MKTSISYPKQQYVNKQTNKHIKSPINYNIQNTYFDNVSEFHTHKTQKVIQPHTFQQYRYVIVVQKY